MWLALTGTLSQVDGDWLQYGALGVLALFLVLMVTLGRAMLEH